MDSATKHIANEVLGTAGSATRPRPPQGPQNVEIREYDTLPTLSQSIEIVELTLHKSHGLVLIDKGDNVWLTFDKPWWNLLAQIEWWVTPGKRAWMILKTKDGEKIRVRAIRIARGYIRMG